MIRIENNQVLTDPPKRPKKITGTRLAAILGLDPWKTPFQIWCDITKVYKEPFEDTIYTIAGKVIEPKVIAYLDKRYFFGKGKLKDPDTFYGKSKEDMHYDHFPREKILGGMWDARTDTCVFELKTSKRYEDWFRDGEFDAPMNYKIQGALYAYLLGLDEFAMVLTITDDKILADPDSFVPTPDNTMFRKYKLSEDFPQFKQLIEFALEWYETHVVGGKSPEWDPKKDAEILKALRTSAIDTSAGDPIAQLIAQIEPLQRTMDAMKPSEDRLKELKDELKALLLQQMKDTDTKVTTDGKTYSYELTKSTGTSVDTARLKADGLYEQYAKSTEKLTLKITTREEQ